MIIRIMIFANGYARGHLAIASVSGSGSSIGSFGEATNNGSGLIQAGNLVAYGQGSGPARGLSANAYSSPTNSNSVYGIDAAGVAEGSGTSCGGYFAAGNTGGTGSHYGIYATVIGAGTDYAGYFSGNVSVTGTLTKGVGALRIDHPLAPEIKYLQHSFVKSPDRKNIYDGIITTDTRGFATVTMPEWFEAVNTEFRYQLTTIGDFAQAIIAEEIKRNTFVIQTDKPLIKVSWRVTGIRHGAFANANRIQVEVERRAEERGLYAHPGASGRSPERGVDRALHPRPLEVAARKGDSR